MVNRHLKGKDTCLYDWLHCHQVCFGKQVLVEIEIGAMASSNWNRRAGHRMCHQQGRHHNRLINKISKCASHRLLILGSEIRFQLSCGEHHTNMASLAQKVCSIIIKHPKQATFALAHDQQERGSSSSASRQNLSTRDDLCINRGVSLFCKATKRLQAWTQQCATCVQIH